jgi:hypothetical protein
MMKRGTKIRRKAEGSVIVIIRHAIVTSRLHSGSNLRRLISKTVLKHMAKIATRVFDWVKKGRLGVTLSF